jgi:hypothetical protein
VADLIAIGRRLNGKKVKKQFGVAWFSGTVTSFSGLQRGEGGVDRWQIIYEDTTRSRSTQLNCGTFCLRGPIFLPPASPNNFASQATVLRHQFPPATVLREPRRRSPVQQH